MIFRVSDGGEPTVLTPVGLRGLVTGRGETCKSGSSATVVESTNRSSPHTRPALTHITTIRSKKPLKISRP